MAEPREPRDAREPNERHEASEPTNGHDEAALAAAARHALHDEELVAAYAAGALGVDEAEAEGRARALVERCAVCRDVHADLVTIAAAHRATAGFVLTSSRDFRLTEEQAQRLRPGVPVVRRPAAAAVAQPAPEGQLAPQASLRERFRAALGSIARPLGGTLVAAGLVGILVGSVSLTAMPAGGPTSVNFDRQEVGAPAATAPAATAPAAQGGENGSDDLATRSAPVDSRLVVLGASAGVALIGLLLLARSRRRVRESG